MSKHICGKMAYNEISIFITTLVILLHVLHFCRGNYTVYDVERLIRDKKAVVSPDVRPNINNTEPTIIRCSFELIALREIDAVFEKVSVVGSMELTWIDERMAWNESEYNGVHFLILSHVSFWTPTVILLNSFEKYEIVGEKSFWPISFLSSGDTRFFPCDIFTAKCSMDVTYYPWDKQTCLFTFVDYGNFYGGKVFFEAGDVRTDFYEGHGEWDLIVGKVTTLYEGGAVGIAFEYQRKPIFIVLNVILPIVFLSFMGGFVFCIPTECGERISYGMTVLLAITVFLTIVGQTLPTSAQNVAVLCYYIVSVIVLNVFILFGIIFNMKVYYKGEKQVESTCLINLLGCLKCRHRKSANELPLVNGSRPTLKDNYMQVEPRRMHIINVHNIEDIAHKFHGYTSRPANNTKNKIARKSGYKDAKKPDSADKNKAPSWKELSSVLDVCFFIVSLLTSMILTSVYFLVVLNP